MFDTNKPLMPYYCDSIPEGVWIHPITGEVYMSNRAMSSLLEIPMTAIEAFTKSYSTGLYGGESVDLDDVQTIRCVRLYPINAVLVVLIEYKWELMPAVSLCGLLPIIYTMVGFAGIPKFGSESPHAKNFSDAVDFLSNHVSARKYVQQMSAPYLRRQRH
jgi:hypothetical protein